jgi:hypothetical protein
MSWGELFSNVGFEVECLTTRDVHLDGQPLRSDLRASNPVDLQGEYILMRARKCPNFVRYYPDWLYRSMPSRVEEGYVIMGKNDATQLGSGWHVREHLDGRFARWTSKSAKAWLRFRPNIDRQFSVIVHGGPQGPANLKLEGIHDGLIVFSHVTQASRQGWSTINVPLEVRTPTADTAGESEMEITLSVDPTFVPKLLTGSADERELGVLVTALYLRELA